MKASSRLDSEIYFLFERLAWRSYTDSSVMDSIIEIIIIILMQDDITPWNYQHLRRYFTPKRIGSEEKLCKILGWKIFTIDQADAAMHFTNGYINSERLSQFLQNIEQTTIRNLYLNGNHLSSTVNLLSNIIFSNLIVLQLSSNKLASIEKIANINTSRLKILLLSDNCITSIKPLAKCNLRQLQTLCLDKNYINQISYHISRMNIRSLVRLQANSNICRSDGLSIIVKNPSQMLESIHQSYSKIIFPRTKQTLIIILQKYPQFERYIYS